MVIISCKHETNESKTASNQGSSDYKGYALIYGPENCQVRGEGLFLKPIDSMNTSIKLFDKKSTIIYSLPLMYRHRKRLYSSGQGTKYKISELEHKVIPYYMSPNYQVFKVWVELKNYHISDSEIDYLLDSSRNIFVSSFYLDGDDKIDSTKLRVLDISNNIKN